MKRTVQINKRGFMTEFLVLLVVIVFTSLTILLLVRYNLLQVKERNEEVQILNMEFIPYGREGTLVMKEFNFCQAVDEQFNCLSPPESFALGEEVHFQFQVESSTSSGQVRLVENYRLLDPSGTVILELDAKNNFNFVLESSGGEELIKMKDYFIVNPDSPEGEYTLELVLENPLLNKKVTLTKKVMIK